MVKTPYLAVFLVSFRASQKSWPDRINIAKGIVGVTAVQFWLLTGIIAWLFYFTGDNRLLAISRPGFYILGAIVGVVNYYVLVTRGCAAAFQREFATLKARQKVLLTAAGIGVIAFSIVFSGFSAFYAQAHRTLN